MSLFATCGTIAFRLFFQTSYRHASRSSQTASHAHAKSLARTHAPARRHGRPPPQRAHPSSGSCAR
eukprot:6206015-Pleurochrysis_carterae.AAC.6